MGEADYECSTRLLSLSSNRIAELIVDKNNNDWAGLEKGADAYIAKPFDEEQLLAQVKNLIQQRKRLHDSFSKKFISNESVDVGNLDNFFLNKVTRIIENNIENEAFSVEKLADEITLSRSQLHGKIKQISNQTTSEYIMMVKIKKATILLASKNYTIDEVSYKSGFNSHSYFTKCFKKIHNVSPKDYVKNLS